MQLAARFFIIAFVTLLGLAACTVKLSDDTPGAKRSCNQSASAMNLFYCGPFRSVIVGETCTSCHSPGSAGSGAMSYDITLGTSCCPDCYAANAAVVSANFCTAFLKGDKLVEFPQSESHTATQQAQKFTASEIQELIDWVNQQQNQ